jgi:hypothetical protein
MLAGVLGGSSAQAAGVQRLLVMDLRAVGVEASVAAQATALCAQALHGAVGVTVLTMEDIRALVSAQAARTMMGCQGEASCAAELASAANVDLILSGSIGRVGSTYSAALALLEVKTGTVRARDQMDAPSALQLARVLDQRVPRLLGLSDVPMAAVGPQKATSLAVMDLVAAGVAQDTASNLTQVLGTELKRVPGASVISRDDIQAMLQMQADKARLGCDDASCLAEIGGALGVEKLVVGSVGRMSGSYLISLRLISVKTTHVENRITESYTGTEDQLIRAVRHAGRSLMGVVDGASGALAVGTAQDGADILVDGVLKGSTPLRPVDGVKPGPHAVTVRRSGYLEWSGDVYVDPADTTVLFVNLQPRPLAWFQRWQLWVAVAGGGATVLLALAALGAVTAVGTVYVVRSTTAPAPSGSGTATVE